MRYLVAFGCSHTYGSMLDGKNSNDLWNVKNSFPGMLAKRYNRELINISMPGGSNQYIFRNVMRYLNNHMDHDDDHLFLINWTGITRFELRYPEDSRHNYKSFGDYKDEKYVPFSAGIKPTLFTHKNVAGLLRFTPYLFDINMLCDVWASYAYTLQTILDKKKIPYLMTNTCNQMLETDNNKSIIKKVHKGNYPGMCDKHEVMVEWLLAQGIEKTECWHFQVDGHELWAEKLHGHLKALGYVK